MTESPGEDVAISDVLEPPEPTKKRTVRSMIVRALLLAMGVAMLGGFLYAAGPAQVAANIGRVGWGFFLLLLVPMMWRTCATAGTWFLLLPEQRVSFLTLFLVRTAGESVNTISFFGNVAGEPIKAFLLKRHLGGTGATSLVLLDKTVFFLGSVTFMATGTLAGLVILADRAVVIFTTLAMLIPWLAALAWIIWRQSKGDFIIQVSRLLGLVRVKLSEKTIAKLTQIDALISQFWRDHKARFFMSYCVHTFGRCLRAFDVWLCVLLLGAHIPWYAAFFSAAAGMLVSSAFVFIPGGLGASEGGHALVFDVIGLGFSLGVTVGIIRRIRNYIIAGLSYLVLVFWPAEPTRSDSPA